MKYNSFVNPCKTDFIISNKAVPTYFAMQGLVKDLTLKTHSNNGLAILYGNKLSL